MMNKKIEKIAVFCGSQMGNSNGYSKATQELADTLCKSSITLVYGGAKIGLMGVLADQMLNNDGKVIGVMPKKLVDIEQAHTRLTDLRIVNSMNERKSVIAELSDAFVMFPGGTGSLDEFFEMFTLTQLGYHDKPCAILNVDNYYDYLIKFLDHAKNEGFLRAQYREMIITANNAVELMEKMMIAS